MKNKSFGSVLLKVFSWAVIILIAAALLLAIWTGIKVVYFSIEVAHGLFWANVFALSLFSVGLLFIVAFIIYYAQFSNDSGFPGS
ncbi:hypothetical protein KYLE_10 [Pantoea phage Kyle]|uniref:Uncharacterized protein n=1 Tax=Pantoea phage Kyle TaxID=2589665 RepID=A0A514A8I8_9CAUD|nr:hypothetical protein HWC52_gp010 [Pantoea phage Kyle]QDH49579.1 hypothetical protein KYLE_10 [Pantoea phage Kyle]